MTVSAVWGRTHGKSQGQIRLMRKLVKPKEGLQFGLQYRTQVGFLLPEIALWL